MNTFTSLYGAVEANITVVRQALELLSALGEERYTRRLPQCFNASIGGHVRHIIEHYLGFLNGLEEQAIDYEKRARDPLIENNPDHASRILEQIEERLTTELGRQPDAVITMAAETAEGVSACTSILRELEFLLSHTVHHFALVAIMARLMGHEPAATFGIAPSTLKYQASQAVCAR